VKAVAVLGLLAAMAGGWAFRTFLLRTLRTRHPQEFAALGSPSRRQLASLLPKHQELHLKFWKYLWEGRAFRVNDRLVSGLASAALIADVALAGSVVLLFWSAGK